MRIIQIYLFLTLFSPFIRAEFDDLFRQNLYNDHYTKNTADITLALSTKDVGINTYIPVHLELMQGIVTIKDPPRRADKKSINLVFERDQEVSAFKKMIFILYKISLPDVKYKYSDFYKLFEPTDFADLTLQAFKYENLFLGKALASFLRIEVNGILRSVENNSTLLEQLSQGEFHDLYNRLMEIDWEPNKNNYGYKNIAWMKDIKDSLFHYIHHMKHKKDPRLKNLNVKFDVNVLRSVVSQQEYAQNVKARKDAELKQALQHHRYEQEAELTAKKIFDKFNKSIIKSGRLKRHTYRVSKELARPIVWNLEPKLNAFDVTYTSPFWGTFIEISPKWALNESLPWLPYLPAQ